MIFKFYGKGKTLSEVSNGLVRRYLNKSNKEYQNKDLPEFGAARQSGDSARYEKAFAKIKKREKGLALTDRRWKRQKLKEAVLDTDIKRNNKFDYDYIGRKFSDDKLKADKWHKISSMPSHDVYMREQEFSFRTSKRILYLALNKKTNIVDYVLSGYQKDNKKEHNKTFEVDTISGNKNNEIKAHDFYAHLIKKHNLIMTGDRHSVGGMKIWQNLAKVKGVNIHGWDMKNMPVNINPHNQDETHEDELSEPTPKKIARQKMQLVAHKGKNFKDDEDIVESVLNKKTLSVEELAAKWKVTVERINQELKKGIAVEKEHTSNPKVASEIARDHIKEKLDYYTRLKKVEEGAISKYIKRGFKTQKQAAAKKAESEAIKAMNARMFNDRNHEEDENKEMSPEEKKHIRNSARYAKLAENNIQELSKKTIRSYVDKAHASFNFAAGKREDDHFHDTAGKKMTDVNGNPKFKARSKKERKADDKIIQKRLKGMSKAYTKLAESSHKKMSYDEFMKGARTPGQGTDDELIQGASRKMSGPGSKTARRLDREEAIRRGLIKAKPKKDRYSMKVEGTLGSVAGGIAGGLIGLKRKTGVVSGIESGAKVGSDIEDKGREMINKARSTFSRVKKFVSTGKLDEISKKTLGSYIEKATDRLVKESAPRGHTHHIHYTDTGGIKRLASVRAKNDRHAEQVFKRNFPSNKNGTPKLDRISKIVPVKVENMPKHINEGYHKTGLKSDGVLGHFKHKETNAQFEYSKHDDPWGLKHGLPHKIHLTGNEERYAKVKGTVAHVAVDENPDGSPKMEKWPLKAHRSYTTEGYVTVKYPNGRTQTYGDKKRVSFSSQKTAPQKTSSKAMDSAHDAIKNYDWSGTIKRIGDIQKQQVDSYKKKV